MKKKVYYAHVLSIYNTIQETRDIITLENLGFDVINPNTPETQKRYKEIGWETFEELIKQCEIFAFRSLPDGTISSGVYKELEFAKTLALPELSIIELPTIMSKRVLSLDDTREYLKLVGQR